MKEEIGQPINNVPAPTPEGTGKEPVTFEYGTTVLEVLWKGGSANEGQIKKAVIEGKEKGVYKILLKEKFGEKTVRTKEMDAYCGRPNIYLGSIGVNFPKDLFEVMTEGGAMYFSVLSGITASYIAGDKDLKYLVFETEGEIYDSTNKISEEEQKKDMEG